MHPVAIEDEQMIMAIADRFDQCVKGRRLQKIDNDGPLFIKGAQPMQQLVTRPFGEDR